MGFSPQRLQTILRANSIYESEILAQCGYKKTSGFLDKPDKRQLADMRKYFANKYPLVNFEFILGNSNSPNRFIDADKVRLLMDKKNITINQFNSFVNKELGKDKAFYYIANGLYPTNKRESDIIMNYLQNLVDNNGDYTYSNNTKSNIVDKKKDSPTTKKRSGRLGYIMDPKNYIENKIDLHILVSMCNKQGYTQQGFVDTVFPNDSGCAFVNNLFRGKVNSIKKDTAQAIEAALDCDLAYLEGTQNIVKTRKHTFPVDINKKFKFKQSFLLTLDTAMLRVMANNAGISHNILLKARGGETIWFVHTCIRKMFTQDMLDVLKFADLNSVLISKGGEKISNILLKNRGRDITLDNPTLSKPAKTKTKVKNTKQDDNLWPVEKKPTEKELSKITTLSENEDSKKLLNDEAINNILKTVKAKEVRQLDRKEDILNDIATRPYGYKPKKSSNKDKPIGIPEFSRAMEERLNGMGNLYNKIVKSKDRNVYHTCKCRKIKLPLIQATMLEDKYGLLYCEHCGGCIDTPVYGDKYENPNVDLEVNVKFNQGMRKAFVKEKEKVMEDKQIERKLNIDDVVRYISVECTTKQLEGLIKLCQNVMDKNSILEQLKN